MSDIVTSPRHTPLEPKNLLRGVFDKPRRINARLCSRIAGAADLHVEWDLAVQQAASTPAAAKDLNDNTELRRFVLSESSVGWASTFHLLEILRPQTNVFLEKKLELELDMPA